MPAASRRYFQGRQNRPDTPNVGGSELEAEAGPDIVMTAFTRRFQVITPDLRGHGASD